MQRKSVVLHNRESCREQMNHLGLAGIPFFFLIDFEMIKCQVYEMHSIPESHFFEFQHKPKFISPDSDQKLQFNKFPIDIANYKKAFDSLQCELAYGNTYLANLTFPTRIETNYNLLELYKLSSSKYKLYLENEFLSFSPETFITIQNQSIHAYPMKGTIDATIPDAEETILNNIKETEEHNTMVDLIRNDLSKIADNINLEKYRYVESITTNNKPLLQVSSEISGLVKSTYQNKIGDILFNLLPAGSISGAPKEKTLEIIKNIEAQERGYYTGIMGLFDGRDVDTCILIRCIEKKGDQLYYRSGGGITHRSDARSEYQEMLDKIYVPFN